MASVTLKRGTKAEIENTQIQDGQLLMETDQLNNNKIYLDLPNGTRVPVGGSGAWVGTKEEFELAVEEGKIADGTQVIITDDYESGITASMTLYSNAQSGLVATNVQSAIDELNSNLSNSNKRINSITNGKGIISFASLGTLEYGVYRTNELTANNSPSGSDTDGILIVLPCIYSSQLCVQIFWGYNTKQVHMRICWYGSYQDWIKLSQ